MDAILEFIKVVMVRVNPWTTGFGFAQLAKERKQREQRQRLGDNG
jgi:hypothetical protein